MSALDILSFVLMAVGGAVAALAGLLGVRAEEGRDALEPEAGDSTGADDLISDARATLERIAGLIARRRRAANWIGLLLLLLGVVAFVVARTDERRSPAETSAG